MLVLSILQKFFHLSFVVLSHWVFIKHVIQEGSNYISLKIYSHCLKFKALVHKNEMSMQQMGEKKGA